MTETYKSSATLPIAQAGTLIQRIRKRIPVEGYTDSFGTPESNFDLSQRRADCVKRYLVESNGNQSRANPNARYGATNSHLAKRLMKSKPNRRVEIVVHTSEG